MSDFYLDFRSKDQRRSNDPESFLTFFSDIRVLRVEDPAFTLIVTRCDDVKLWGPYRSTDSSVLVAVAGRLAFDEREWEEAKGIGGDGGLACKAVYRLYTARGLPGLVQLNGNFVVLVHDAVERKFFIVTDRSGAFPIFYHDCEPIRVFASHPDVIARATDCRTDLDQTSLAEFLATGKVTHPFTYYKFVRSAEFGVVYTVNVNPYTAQSVQMHRYFSFEYRLDERITEEDTAQQLARAFRHSIRRRTLPIFGTTAIALSGGLDSRTILCACPKEANVKAFCFFDEENAEFRTAKAIAKARGLSLIPFRRELEHYGDSAEFGVRIYGGMGSFVNNHFLAFRERFIAEGFDNFLTGFYCDYLFKGLGLNIRRNRLLRTEGPAEFSLQHYRPLIPLPAKWNQRVMERLERLFPAELRRQMREEDLLTAECRRLFPLSYEPDNAETIVPQRVMPWFLPIVDNEILDVYQMIPPRFKYNCRVYSRMVMEICGKVVSRIPDNNTGAPVGAPHIVVMWHAWKKALENKYHRNVRPRLATSGSWPNWEYYIQHSATLRRLWFRENLEAKRELGEILQIDFMAKPISEYRGLDSELFMRILTLKIWFDVMLGIASNTDGHEN